LRQEPYRDTLNSVGGLAGRSFNRSQDVLVHRGACYGARPLGGYEAHAVLAVQTQRTAEFAGKSISLTIIYSLKCQLIHEKTNASMRELTEFCLWMDAIKMHEIESISLRSSLTQGLSSNASVSALPTREEVAMLGNSINFTLTMMTSCALQTEL